MNLTPIITTAGLNAVINAANDGVNAKIVSIVLGDAAWEPDLTAVTLQNERARVPISGSTRVNPTQIHLTAIENGDVEYWVREIGFVLEDGTLLAVWSQSDQDQPLAYKAAAVDLLLGFDLVLSALPTGSVVVEDSGGLNLGPATVTLSGVIRLATEDEALEKTRNDVAMSPATTAAVVNESLSESLVQATQVQVGVARFATMNESFEPDNTDVMMSPATVRMLGDNAYRQRLVFGPVQLTEFINSLDGVLDYLTPPGTIMVGINSFHDNRTEDRRFRIRYQSITLDNG